MIRAAAWLRRWYGAQPLHLLALLAAFALAGYAVHAVAVAGQWRGFLVWFAVAIVGHDLLLFPLYSLADLSLRRLLPQRAREQRAREQRARELGAAPGRKAGRAAKAQQGAAAPRVLNHIRMPAGFSLLLLLVWFPLILGLSSASYRRASGLSTSPYLWRWLAVTGAAFLVSAVCYALRLRRAARRLRRGALRQGAPR